MLRNIVNPLVDLRRLRIAQCALNAHVVPFDSAQTEQRHLFHNATRVRFWLYSQFHLYSGTHMTLTLNKTHSTEMDSMTTAQDHHLKAAEHLALASTCHKETAKLIQGGDHHAASSHAKLAAEHTAHAAHQVTQAAKKSSGQPTKNK
jgi:hypothetical protein